jgi:hypothetical protein
MLHNMLLNNHYYRCFLHILVEVVGDSDNRSHRLVVGHRVVVVVDCSIGRIEVSHIDFLGSMDCSFVILQFII